MTLTRGPDLSDAIQNMSTRGQYHPNISRLRSVNFPTKDQAGGEWWWGNNTINKNISKLNNMNNKKYFSL